MSRGIQPVRNIGAVLRSLGDLLYRGPSGLATLPGNTSATRQFLRQVGTGSASAPPAWDTLLVSDLPVLEYVFAYANATQSLTSGQYDPVALNAELVDTNTLHYPGRLDNATLTTFTGTVAKTAASNALVGTGTLFLTEAAVGMVVKVPGTADEVRVITGITDNLNLTVLGNFNNTASGQTMTVQNSAIVIRTAGRYLPLAAAQFASNATGRRIVKLTVNRTLGSETDIAIDERPPLTGANTTFNLPGVPRDLSANQFVEMQMFQSSGGALNSIASGSLCPVLVLIRISGT